MPVISECDGNYVHESRRNKLIWSLPLIDSSNKTGSLEFSVAKAIPNDFFPLNVNFTSKTSFANIKVSSFKKKECKIILITFTDYRSYAC